MLLLWYNAAVNIRSTKDTAITLAAWATVLDFMPALLGQIGEIAESKSQ